MKARKGTVPVWMGKQANEPRGKWIILEKSTKIIRNSANSTTMHKQCNNNEIVPKTHIDIRHTQTYKLEQQKDIQTWLKTKLSITLSIHTHTNNKHTKHIAAPNTLQKIHIRVNLKIWRGERKREETRRSCRYAIKIEPLWR